MSSFEVSQDNGSFISTIKYDDPIFLGHKNRPFIEIIIREALETIGNLNNIALDNYCSTLMKVRTRGKTTKKRTCRGCRTCHFKS